MKYKVITTGKGKVVIDETAEIKIDDYYFNHKTQTVQKRTHGTDNESYMEFLKVILSINFSLDKEIPMVTVEDEVERLANINGYHDQPSDDLYKEGFFDGYYASQQKGVYSEEELRFIYDTALHATIGNLNHDEEFNRVLSFLKQEYIELEREHDDTVPYPKMRIKTSKVHGQLVAYIKQ